MAEPEFPITADRQRIAALEREVAELRASGNTYLNAEQRARIAEIAERKYFNGSYQLPGFRYAISFAIAEVCGPVEGA